MGIGQPCRIPRQAMKWPDSLVGQVAALGLRRRCAGGDDCAAIWGNYCLCEKTPIFTVLSGQSTGTDDSPCCNQLPLFDF